MNEPTLLMIHGLVGSLDYFDPSARIHGATVTTLDLLGYGRFREAWRDGLTLQLQAEHVASYIDTLPDRRVWLLGHSMGGAVAMLVADQCPELVSGIINVEGNFTLKDTFWSGRIIAKPLADWSRRYDAMLDDVVGTTRDWGFEPNDRHVEWVRSILEHQPAETVYAMSKALVEETGGPEYIRLVRRVVGRHTPIHLIAGERSAGDWNVPGFVRAAARSYTEVAGAGHLMMLEQPVAFCRNIDNILASS